MVLFGWKETFIERSKMCLTASLIHPTSRVVIPVGPGYPLGTHCPGIARHQMVLYYTLGVAIGSEGLSQVFCIRG